MKKKLVILILILNTSYCLAVYIPCEASIGIANTQFELKLKITTAKINLKTAKLKQKYENYLSKLKELNQKTQGNRQLQIEKNKLLLDVKNQLSGIKNEIYLGDDIEKNK